MRAPASKQECDLLGATRVLFYVFSEPGSGWKNATQS
jgi:hypothetical protein